MAASLWRAGEPVAPRYCELSQKITVAPNWTGGKASLPRVETLHSGISTVYSTYAQLLSYFVHVFLELTTSHW